MRPADINVVVDGSNMLRGRVNIISYDMVNRILDRVTDRRFQVIVAVRQPALCLPSPSPFPFRAPTERTCGGREGGAHRTSRTF